MRFVLLFSLFAAFQLQANGLKTHALDEKDVGLIDCQDCTDYFEENGGCASLQDEDYETAGELINEDCEVCVQDFFSACGVEIPEDSLDIDCDECIMSYQEDGGCQLLENEEYDEANALIPEECDLCVADVYESCGFDVSEDSENCEDCITSFQDEGGCMHIDNEEYEEAEKLIPEECGSCFVSLYESCFESSEEESSEEESIGDDWVIDSEFEVGDLNFGYYVDNLCDIAKGICIDGRAPTADDIELSEMVDFKGTKTCYFHDDTNMKALDLIVNCENNDIILGGEIYDYEDECTKVFSEEGGRYFVSPKYDNGMSNSELEDEAAKEELSSAERDEEEYLAEHYPEFLAAAKDSKLKLQDEFKSGRRRLSNGKNWYSIDVWFSKVAAQKAKEHSSIEQNVAQAMVELNQGYVNSGIPLEGHLYNVRISPINFKAARSCAGVFGNTHMTGVFDFLYKGPCNRGDKGRFMRPFRKREDIKQSECENACANQAQCQGIQFEVFSDSGREPIGFCELIVFGDRWRKPNVEECPNCMCYKYDKHFGADADVTVLIFHNREERCGINHGKQIGTWAFLNTRALTGTYTFAHEIGHAIGLQHNEAAEFAKCKEFGTYNCGYIPICATSRKSKGWRTIMAYSSIETF